MKKLLFPGLRTIERYKSHFFPVFFIFLTLNTNTTAYVDNTFILEAKVFNCYNKSIEDVEVNVLNTSYSAATNADGLFRIKFDFASGAAKRMLPGLDIKNAKKIGIYNLQGRLLHEMDAYHVSNASLQKIGYILPYQNNSTSVCEIETISGKQTRFLITGMYPCLASTAPEFTQAATATIGLAKTQADYAIQLKLEKANYISKNVSVELISDSVHIEIMMKQPAHAVSSEFLDSLFCSRNESELEYINNPDSVRVWYVTDDEYIQDVIEQANNYDIIQVAQGTYVLDSSLVIDKKIAVRSIFGPDATIVDGNKKARCVLMTRRSTGCILEGFTLQNGDADGPYNWSSDSHENEKECDDGGGIFTCGCSCNIGYHDAGPLPYIRSCKIINNHCGSMGGAGVHLKGGTLENCLIANNVVTGGGKGGAVACKDKTVKLINCTITHNRTGIWIRQQSTRFDTMFFVNSIIAQNEYTDWDIDDVVHFVMRNCITTKFTAIGSTVDTANVQYQNPQFSSSATNDFTVLPNSPGKDNGFTNHPFFSKNYCNDLAGNSRKQGVQIDIGAYEIGDTP
ncbi:MAG: hypothetical protein GF398_01760 [Chitinivibrionales bacterium]|nr:hypothetical protein [Chitinivibrionales bacterium]